MGQTPGGYPYPIMLCNITQNAMGQTPGGYPYPIMLCNITQNAMGQIPGGVPSQVQLGGVPCQVRMGGAGYPGRVPPLAGYTPWLDQDGGYPGRVPPPQQGTPQARMGGTQVGYPLAGYPHGPGGGYPGRVTPCRVPPQPGSGWRGYPVRTTEGVLTTRRAVCLLCSRRRTFLLIRNYFTQFHTTVSVMSAVIS